MSPNHNIKNLITLIKGQDCTKISAFKLSLDILDLSLEPCRLMTDPTDSTIDSHGDLIRQQRAKCIFSSHPI